MKYLFILILMLSFSMAISGCESSNSAVQNPLEHSSNPQTNTKMKITVGIKTFTATFQNNAAAAAFKEMLPLTLDMNELNGNEKYAPLPNSLTTISSNPGTIQRGDLMLYGNNTLVLFYESFSTSYSYTRIGKIDDISALKNALGAGNVTVKFELQ